MTAKRERAIKALYKIYIESLVGSCIQCGIYIVMNKQVLALREKGGEKQKLFEILFSVVSLNAHVRLLLSEVLL